MGRKQSFPRHPSPPPGQVVASPHYDGGMGEAPHSLKDKVTQLRQLYDALMAEHAALPAQQLRYSASNAEGTQADTAWNWTKDYIGNRCLTLTHFLGATGVMAALSLDKASGNAQQALHKQRMLNDFIAIYAAPPLLQAAAGQGEIPLFTALSTELPIAAPLLAQITELLPRIHQDLIELKANAPMHNQPLPGMA